MAEALPLLCRLSDLTPEPIDWLWPGYFAAGKLTLMDGDPDRGKSLLALDLAARLTTGQAWPDGQPGSGPQSVIIMASEDGIKDTLLPRLRAAGADLTRVHLFGRVSHNATPCRQPRLPEDCLLLREMVQAAAARMVIADPLCAFLSANSCLNDSAVRNALSPLAQLAEETRACVAMTRHLNKGGGRQAIYRGSGSIALIGLARTAFLAGRSADDPNLHVLACTKNNLATPPPALGYRIVQAEGQPVIDWHGPVATTADELVLGPPRVHGEALPAAVAFLTQELHDGPRPSDELRRQARATGIADRTLDRAKTQLGVVAEQEWIDDCNLWVWRLPNKLLNLPPEEAHRRLLEAFWKDGESPQPDSRVETS
jgi:hypothetical protein